MCLQFNLIYFYGIYKMNSTIFLHNVTHVDCAVVDPVTKKPRGLSFVPMFAVSGSTDNKEQVVEDFSNIKKRIKAVIDGKDDGYDHKLIVFRTQDEQHFDVKPEQEYLFDATEEAGWSVSMQYNAFKVIRTEKPATEDTYLDVVAKDMSEFLTGKLGLQVRVVIPHPVPVWPNGLPLLAKESSYTTYETFSYTHGLPHSSSWGCQNVVHGHQSFVFLASEAFIPEGEHYGQDLLFEAQQSITSYLDGAYIVCQDHYVFANETQFVRYKTEERGSFELRLPADAKVIVLPNEPTIENITSHVATVFEEQLVKANVCALAISEGLWKGAVVEFPGQEG